MRAVDAVVIGAGFAGLTTARALRDGGADALVLEAQNEPGGRVRTIYLPDGVAYETGGQFFCRDMTHVCALVETFGLTRRDLRKDPGIVAMLGGQRKNLTTDFLEHGFFKMIFEADPSFPGSLGDWVQSLGLDAEAVAMMKSGCEEVMGRPIEELSFRSTLDCLSRFESFENTMEYCCVEGLGTLAGLMARDLGTNFKANTPVTSVDRKDGLFHLTTPHGMIAARKIVYAASPVVLRQIDWKAPKDQWLNEQSARFVAGKMRKIVLRYAKAFWRGSDFGWLGQTDSPSGLSVMDCSDLTDQLCVLTVFCGGTAAMALEGLSDSAALAKVMDIIEPMLGPGVRNPITVVQTNWTDHPWVGGGYATWPKPWHTADPWAPMRTSHDGLHFTGAELASAYPGFIEGAIRAGHETAARVQQEG
jgi:monoamine oxidase